MVETMRQNGKEAQQKRKSAISNPEMITRQRLHDLLENQEYRCALSGVTFESPSDMTGDHIVPVAHGGMNVMSNIQLVHGTVNAMKGTLSQEEFIRWCKLIAEHADCAQ